MGSKDEEGEAGKNMGELLPGEKLKNNPNRAWEAEESRTIGSIKNNQPETDQDRQTSTDSPTLEPVLFTEGVSRPLKLEYYIYS